MNVVDITVEPKKVPEEIEQILKAMPISHACELHEWMSQGVLGLTKVPRYLMESYLAAKEKVGLFPALLSQQ
jgi:hypothetical protein